MQTKQFQLMITHNAFNETFKNFQMECKYNTLTPQKVANLITMVSEAFSLMKKKTN